MRIVVFVVGLLCAIEAEIAGDIPDCNYFDTVDLSNSLKFDNGSYQYEDILIPKEKVGQYKYQILFGGEEETVSVHTRGCACQIRSCVRFCCHPQKFLDQEGRCVDYTVSLNYSSLLNITMDDGQEMQKDFMEFIVQRHLPVPCRNPLILDPTNENHGWTLFENGTLFRHYDATSLSKRDYCLQPILQSDNQLILLPHHCMEPIDRTNAYIQIVSICFMIIIIIAYLLLPIFNSIHGNCCTCFFSCLTISFVMVNIMVFEWIDISDGIVCKFFGYAGYYVVMATFCWLSVINYNLWKTFNNIGVSRKARFLRYNVIVWSVAAVLLLVTFLIDYFDEFMGIPIDLIPGIGLYTCWINTVTWSAMIYYFGPMLLLLLCNITLFVKTTKQIFVQNRKNRRQLKLLECQRNLKNLTNFKMFFRLFIIVGVIWILEISSYLLQFTAVNRMWIRALDSLTSGQGVILFIVTLLKKDVLNDIVDRFRHKRKQSGFPTRSNSSQVPMTEVSLVPKRTRSLSN